MSATLLNNTRKLQRFLNTKDVILIDLNKLCECVSDIMDADCRLYAVTKSSGVSSTRENLSLKELKKFFPDISSESQMLIQEFYTAIPVEMHGIKLSNLIIGKNTPFDLEDIIFAEQVATIAALVLDSNNNASEESRFSSSEKAKAAVLGLTLSEKEAAYYVFSEINNGAGVVKASELSDNYHITRSIIVNMLRKFVSAGVVETTSHGVKGTEVKVLNDSVFAELKACLDK